MNVKDSKVSSLFLSLWQNGRDGRERQQNIVYKE